MKLADKCHENVFYGIILCCCNKCYCDRGNIILFSGKLDCFYTNNDCFGVSHLLEGYNIWKDGLFFNKRRVYGIGTTYLLWMGIERKLYRKKPSISYRHLDVECPSKTNIYTPLFRKDNEGLDQALRFFGVKHKRAWMQIGMKPSICLDFSPPEGLKVFIKCIS